ncbi:hypothetical protein BLA60_08405 [Actinophytocola xinjiangensis]|uniref:Peptidase S8/S53 domain-containing protein n=1 Tax=Actinophytocola xinjiangensis TaxID=485602 RepID=A0A7Z1AYP6_9PSEU|nr:hypothetical protein BLA60_08405 [Actinophytocola xinjiangensis]
MTTTIAALGLSGAVAGSADPPTDPPTVPAPAAPASGASTTVTLLTGDVVEYTVDRNGQRRVALSPVSNPDRLGVGFMSVPEGDAYYVYPTDALPLINSGRLDPTLFDVAYLAENGFGDDATDALPVIAQYGASVRSAGALSARADALPASDDVIPLASVRGAGIDIAKDEAGEFWSAITGSAKNSRAGATTLDAGLSKVWMDRRVTPTLDRSTAQIGAPQAWKSGYDGTGVKVAVLDTGLDFDHPDFEGRVIASENFTVDASIHDGFGHGTHVASIVAGSGKASDGRYRGVAPGASLMIGKVLGDLGTGSSSAVIAGMEWAAANGADVVNMSLGGGRTDGTDPQSQAVNNLTAQYGSLFVVAAGNSGPGPQTLGAPGVADAALSVAAVDRNDSMASFSSRGPRIGDFGLKPDIAAPGVGITAARSEPSIMGGDPGARYMSANGTSMASPHVAGAAAILAQKNPEWTAGKLKPVLVSTAKDAGHRSYEQGAGRVDIPRALSQQVYATGNLDFGQLAHPQTEKVDQTVGFVNDSDEPVTLDLSASLSTEAGPAPDGMLAIDQDQVTVPANGSAKVTVTVDPTIGEPTWYEGALRASAQGIEVGAAIGFYKEPESFEVTGKVILPDGVPVDSVQAFFFTRDDGRLDRTMSVRAAPAVETTARLHGGRHTASVLIGWVDENGYNNAVGMKPEFDVTGDTTVTIDLRRIQRIEVDTPKDAVDYTSIFGILRLGAGNVGGVQATASAAPAEGMEGWMLPTDTVDIGILQSFSQHVLGAQPIEMTVAGKRGPRLHGRYTSPDSPSTPRLDGRRTLPLVDGGTGTAADLAGVNARGALVLVDLSEFCQQTLCARETADRVAEVAKTGAAAVLAYGPRGHVMLGTGGYPIFSLPAMSIPTDEARMLLDRLAQGQVRIDTRGTATSPYRYHLAFSDPTRVPADLRHEVAERDLYRIDHRFHSDAPSTYSQTYSGMNVRMSVAGNIGTAPRRAQSTLTDYVGPVSKDLLWARSVSYTYDELVGGLNYGPGYGSLDVFATKGSRTETWNSRPLTTAPPSTPRELLGNPWVTSTCYTCRAGDMFVFGPNTLDPAGHSGGNTRKEEYRLTMDGEEIELKERGFLVNALFFLLRVKVVTFDVPAERNTYQLHHRTIDKPFPQMRYSGTENSTYTFSSERASESRFASCIGQTVLGRAEPCVADTMLRLGYDTQLALDNTARAGSSQRITVRGLYGNGLAAPKLRSLELWASADDGRTWQKIRTHQRDGEFTGTIEHPSLRDSTGAITLRAKAVDVNGNTVDQTIDRAYGLR